MGKLKRLNHWAAALCLLAFTLGSTLADPNSSKVKAVNVQVNQGVVELSIQADKPVQVRTLQLDTPTQKIIFDIYPSVLWGKKETKPVGRFGITDVRVAQFSSDPDVTRVVADLESPLKYKIITSEDGKNLKIAFGASNPSSAALPPPAVSPSKAVGLKPVEKEAPTVAAESKSAEKEAPIWKHAQIVQKVVSPETSPAVYANLPPALRPTLVSPSLQTKLSSLFRANGFKKKKKVAKAAVPKEQAVSFTWKNADLTDVIRSLADRMGLNVIVDTSVKGSVTLDLKNVPAGQALGMILAINGFSSRQIGNILVVGPADKLDKLPTTPIAVGPEAIQVIPLENRSPGDLRETVVSEYPEVKVEADSKTNSLLVKGSVSAIRKVKELVAELDKPVMASGAAAAQREVIRLNYAVVKDILTTMKSLLPSDAVLVADDRMNSIIVSGSQYAIDSVKSFVSTVDVPSPQVMLEMQVLSVNVTGDRNLGVTWGGSLASNFAETSAGEPGGSMPAPGGTVQAANNISLQNLGFHTFVRDNVGFKMTINYLVTHSKAKILGSPRIATLNNKEASIHLGDHIPIIYFDPRAGLYQAQYIDVGVVLKITPTISPDGSIQIHLNPSVSNVTGFQQNFPQISSKDADTTLRVKNGETIILGGLLSETDTDAIAKIPLLGDIPILGQFFRNRTTHHDKTDLIISVTPTVIANR